MIHVLNSSRFTVVPREMDFWWDTMNELYDIVWKIKQQQHSENDLKRGLELIDEADEEPFIPHALQYRYCKMVVLECHQFYKHFKDCSDTRSD